MTPARIASIERGLNSTLRKVLDATPIQEAWTMHEIGGELFRIGRRLDYSVIDGCLNALKREGLVKEPETGRFTRVKPSPQVHLVTQPIKEIAVPLPSPTPSAPAPAPDPFADLEALAADLIELSDKADKIAGALRARLAEAESQVTKFKQFQELLKGMA